MHYRFAFPQQCISILLYFFNLSPSMASAIAMLSSHQVSHAMRIARHQSLLTGCDLINVTGVFILLQHHDIHGTNEFGWWMVRRGECNGQVRGQCGEKEGGRGGHWRRYNKFAGCFATYPFLPFSAPPFLSFFLIALHQDFCI